MALIVRPASGVDLAPAALLMRDLMLAIYRLHPEFAEFLDKHLDAVAFERELADLPGEYAPPSGALFVADADGAIVGCVALRALSGRACELKRMFVAPVAEGKGVGRMLANAAIRQGKALGYECMFLDTGPNQVRALALYESVGFSRTGPYYAAEAPMRDWLVFMQLDLRQRVAVDP